MEELPPSPSPVADDVDELECWLAALFWELHCLSLCGQASEGLDIN